jgi:Tfp pilus assembly protein PilF
MVKSFRVTTRKLVVAIGCIMLACGTDSALHGADCSQIENALTRANAALDQRKPAVTQRVLATLDTVNCERVVLLTARLAEAMGNLEDAGRRYVQYTTLAPNDAKGLAYFGAFLLDNGRYPQAESASQRASALDPRLAEVLLLRGRILGLKGQMSKAKMAFTKAIELSPNNPEIHYQVGIFHDGQQQSHKAAASFEKVVRLTPNDPRAYDYLALNLEPTGDVERTEWAYQRGLSLNRGPRFDSFLDYNYGRFLVKKNRLEEAKKHLNRAVILTPQARSSYYERGKLNLKLGNLRAARDDAERALVLKDPGGVILDLQVHYLLARIHARLGDQEEARRYSELSRKLSIPLAARQGKGRGLGR